MCEYNKSICICVTGVWQERRVYLRTIGQDHRGGGEGDLVYPNRLTVNKTTGDIIVTERSPTHQVNVYSRDGSFVRKFGASILQHPRGITVDNLGRIIVVECKVHG